MSDNINFDYKNLSPFKWFVLENFPFIEADFDALTEWQLFCKLGKEINKIIDSQNIVGEQAEILTNAFNNLKNYVDNYFNNLDVQDEINNKLNNMVQTGELQEIIASYLNSKAIFGFDNVESMKNATNLINGSYAQTLGYHTKNDGGKALYKIKTITNEDIVDEMFIIALNNTSLIAELIYNDTINVKQLGAYGDNEHDDTLIIQSALDKGKSSVYIPEGIYNISDTLYLKDTKKLYGNMPTKCAINSIDNSKDILQLPNGDTYNIIIENLRLQHETIGNGNGIVFGNNGNWQLNKINNCRFYNNNVAIYVKENTGSLYSSEIKNCEIFNFNDSAIKLINIGSSGNVYSNIYIHNNNRNASYGIRIALEDNLNANNLNIEWGKYTTAPLYLQQCNGVIENIHYEGVESQVAFQFLNNVQVKILNAWLNFVNSSYSIFNVDGNNIKVDIDILKIINNTNSNQNVKNLLYTDGTHVLDNNEIRINQTIYPTNVIFEANNKRFGSHIIPEISWNIVFCEKIRNIWKAYQLNDSLFNDNTAGNQIEFIYGKLIDNVLKGKAICIASGITNDELLTNDASVTQYSSYVQFPKSIGALTDKTSIKIGDNIYITSGNSYSYNENYYRINLTKPVTNTTGTYSLYKTQAQYDYV